MKRILITGANGFIGRHLLAQLHHQKIQITALVRNQKRLASCKMPNLKSVTGDISDKEAVIASAAGCDAVVHLAAATDVSNYEINFRTNVIGVKHIIEACFTHNIKRIIFFSSHCAIRKHRDAYGVTKKMGEELIERSGLAYTIFRPNMICGKGSNEFETFVNIIRTFPIVPLIGDGTNLFQPSYIMDITRMILHALWEPKAMNRYYSVGGKVSLTADQLVHLISHKLNLKRRILHIPVPICVMGARVLGLFSSHTLVSVDQVLAFTQNNVCEIKALENDLAYHPTPIDQFLDDIL